LRLGAISAELESIRRRECDFVTQGSTPFRLGNRRAVAAIRPHRKRRGYITPRLPG
jgi:hypothetical protein